MLSAKFSRVKSNELSLYQEEEKSDFNSTYLPTEASAVNVIKAFQSAVLIKD